MLTSMLLTGFGTLYYVVSVEKSRAYSFILVHAIETNATLTFFSAFILSYSTVLKANGDASFAMLITYLAAGSIFLAGELEMDTCLRFYGEPDDAALRHDLYLSTASDVPVILFWPASTEVLHLSLMDFLVGEVEQSGTVGLISG